MISISYHIIQFKELLLNGADVDLIFNGVQIWIEIVKSFLKDIYENYDNPIKNNTTDLLHICVDIVSRSNKPNVFYNEILNVEQNYMLYNFSEYTNIKAISNYILINSIKRIIKSNNYYYLKKSLYKFRYYPILLTYTPLTTELIFKILSYL